jgi:hypothetical protein
VEALIRRRSVECRTHAGRSAGTTRLPASESAALLARLAALGLCTPGQSAGLPRSVPNLRRLAEQGDRATCYS